MAEYKRVEIPGTRFSVPVMGNGKHPRVPTRDEAYMFREPLCVPILFGIEANTPVMLTGNAGGGKSSLVQQLAAISGVPLVRFNCHTGVDDQMLIGAKEPDGETKTFKWIDGPVVQAMRNGWWLLLDEIDRATQPVLFVLQSVLEDDGKLELPTKEVVEKHPNFRIFASANTVGAAGAHRSFYVGAPSRMDEATLDRFGAAVYVDYMPIEMEKEILLRKVPDAHPKLVDAMLSIASEVRQQLESDNITATFSTRRMLHWARATVFGMHPRAAAEITILNKLDPEDASVLRGFIERSFGKNVDTTELRKKEDIEQFLQQNKTKSNKSKAK